MVCLPVYSLLALISLFFGEIKFDHKLAYWSYCVARISEAAVSEWFLVQVALKVLLNQNSQPEISQSDPIELN